MLELDVHIQTDGKAEAIIRVLKDADKEPVMFPSVQPDIFQDYATRQMHTRQRTGVLAQYCALLRESRSHMTTVLNGGILYAIKFCAARMTPYHGAKSACHDGCAPRRTSDRGTKSACQDGSVPRTSDRGTKPACHDRLAPRMVTYLGTKAACQEGSVPRMTPGPALNVL